MNRASRRFHDPVPRAATASAVHDGLHAALNTLSEREAAIVSLVFGLSDARPRTLNEVGLMYGVTKWRIRQILEKAMSALRDPSLVAAMQNLDDDGLPPAVMALLRGKAEGERRLLHCARHGWVDPDSVPPASQWHLLQTLPRFCRMCPCPLPVETGGRPATSCCSACRQAARRFQQQHPRVALTPAQVTTAARLRDEGGTVELIARSLGVSQSTLRRHLATTSATSAGPT